MFACVRVRLCVCVGGGGGWHMRLVMNCRRYDCTLNCNGQNDRLHNDCRQLTFNKNTVGKMIMAEITNGKMTVYEMCVDETTVDQKRCCPENYFERCELTIDIEGVK